MSRELWALHPWDRVGRSKPSSELLHCHTCPACSARRRVAGDASVNRSRADPSRLDAFAKPTAPKRNLTHTPHPSTTQEPGPYGQPPPGRQALRDPPPLLLRPRRYVSGGRESNVRIHRGWTADLTEVPLYHLEHIAVTGAAIPSVSSSSAAALGFVRAARLGSSIGGITSSSSTTTSSRRLYSSTRIMVCGWVWILD